MSNDAANKKTGEPGKRSVGSSCWLVFSMRCESTIRPLERVKQINLGCASSDPGSGLHIRGAAETLGGAWLRRWCFDPSQLDASAQSCRRQSRRLTKPPADLRRRSPMTNDGKPKRRRKRLKNGAPSHETPLRLTAIARQRRKRQRNHVSGKDQTHSPGSNALHPRSPLLLPAWRDTPPWRK